MRNDTEDNITAFLAGLALFALVFVALDANAGEGYQKKPPPPTKHVTNNVDRSNTANPTADAAAQSDAFAFGGASTADNNLSIGGDSVENNSSNTVLVPNNNTESCLRVWGIAWGEGGKSGALGVPWRSKACDFEQAADDAFAAGERSLGWFWKCQNKSLARPFKLDGITWDEAKYLCHQKAVGVIDNLATIDKLRGDIKFLQNERNIERAKCNESKNRIVEACQEK